MLSASVIAGLVPMVCWGVGDFLQSIVIRKIGSYKTMFIGNIVWATFFLPFFFFVDLNIALNNLILLSLCIFLMIGAVDNFYQSLKIGEISIVVPISATYSLITTVLLIIFLKQSFSFFTILAILILIAGIVLTSTDLKKIKDLHTVIGVKEALIAMFLWGIYFFLLEIVAKDITLIFHFPQTKALTLSFYTGTLLGFGLVIYSLLRKGYMSYKEVKKTKILPLVIVIQIISFIAWIVINSGFTTGNAAIITAVSSLFPAIAVILAIIFYKEKLVLNQKLGILTILFGLFLISL